MRAVFCSQCDDILAKELDRDILYYFVHSVELTFVQECTLRYFVLKNNNVTAKQPRKRRKDPANVAVGQLGWVPDEWGEKDLRRTGRTVSKRGATASC